MHLCGFFVETTRIPSTIIDVGIVFGVILLLRIIFGVAGFVYLYCLRPRPDLKRLGDWAIVTGASSGIGPATALELARSGLNVALIARKPDLLEGVKADILAKTKGAVEVDIILVDFTDGPEKYVPIVESAMKGRTVGVLVNNVGLSYPYARPYLALDESTADALVAVNVTSMNHLTRLFLPDMVNRKRGAVINVGSGAGLFPSAYLAAYAGTKAYVDAFSKALAIEYGPLGIDIAAHHPLFVCSKMSKQKNPSFTVPSESTYARAAVRMIGSGRSSILPYWPHYIQYLLVSTWPFSLIAVPQITAMHKSIYKRGLEKEKKQGN